MHLVSCRNPTSPTDSSDEAIIEASEVPASRTPRTSLAPIISAFRSRASRKPRSASRRRAVSSSSIWGRIRRSKTSSASSRIPTGLSSIYPERAGSGRPIDQGRAATAAISISSSGIASLAISTMRSPDRSTEGTACECRDPIEEGDVGDIDRDAHHILHVRPIGAQDHPDVLEHLHRLGANVALADDTSLGIEGHLSRDEEQRSALTRTQFE